MTLALTIPATLIAFLVGESIFKGRHINIAFSHPGVARAVIGAALYLTVVGLFGLGLGAIVRNTAGGIATFAGIMFVLPPLMNVLPTELEQRGLAVPAAGCGAGDHVDHPGESPASLGGLRPSLRVRSRCARDRVDPARPPRHLAGDPGYQRLPLVPLAGRSRNTSQTTRAARPRRVPTAKTIRLLVTALVRVAPPTALIVPRTAILRPVRAKIKEKREVAKGTLLVVFDLLGAEVDFRAGQYFWVTLLDPPYDDEKGPRRHISVVTSPNERGVLGLCTRLRDSAFKRSLAELPVGTEVDVEEPKGNFLLPEDTDRPYVFIAGGIGITVFRCMLRYIAEEQLPYRVTLIYSNRDRASSAFLDELAELEQKENLRVVLTMTDDPDWGGESRRIGADLLHDHLGSDLGSFDYLVAGPPPMVEGVEETLRTVGVPEESIHPDRFSGY